MKNVLFCVDGFSFRRINDFYRDEHVRRTRLQPLGLKQWVRELVNQKMNWGAYTNQLSIECHFYHPYEDPRDRLGLSMNMQGGLRFEELLREAGYTMHYASAEAVRRLRPNMDLCDDVLLSAVYGKVDAVVLFSTQGQYADLLQRLQTLDIPVLLVGFEGLCKSRSGELIPWRTDRRLKQCCTHYVDIRELVGLEACSPHPFVNQLFAPRGAGIQMRLMG